MTVQDLTKNSDYSAEYLWNEVAQEQNSWFTSLPPTTQSVVRLLTDGSQLNDDLTAYRLIYQESFTPEQVTSANHQKILDIFIWALARQLCTQMETIYDRTPNWVAQLHQQCLTHTPHQITLTADTRANRLRAQATTEEETKTLLLITTWSDPSTPAGQQEQAINQDPALVKVNAVELCLNFIHPLVLQIRQQPRFSELMTSRDEALTPLENKIESGRRQRGLLWRLILLNILTGNHALENAFSVLLNPSPVNQNLNSLKAAKVPSDLFELTYLLSTLKLPNLTIQELRTTNIRTHFRSKLFDYVTSLHLEEVVTSNTAMTDLARLASIPTGLFGLLTAVHILRNTPDPKRLFKFSWPTEDPMAMANVSYFLHAPWWPIHLNPQQLIGDWLQKMLRATSLRHFPLKEGNHKTDGPGLSSLWDKTTNDLLLMHRYWNKPGDHELCTNYTKSVTNLRTLASILWPTLTPEPFNPKISRWDSSLYNWLLAAEVLTRGLRNQTITPEALIVLPTQFSQAIAISDNLTIQEIQTSTNNLSDRLLTLVKSAEALIVFQNLWPATSQKHPEFTQTLMTYVLSFAQEHNPGLGAWIVHSLLKQTSPNFGSASSHNTRDPAATETNTVVTKPAVKRPRI